MSSFERKMAASWDARTMLGNMAYALKKAHKDALLDIDISNVVTVVSKQHKLDKWDRRVLEGELRYMLDATTSWDEPVVVVKADWLLQRIRWKPNETRIREVQS